MARSIFTSPSPSLAPPIPGDNQFAGSDLSAASVFMISMVFFIGIILNFVLRLYLATKYNQRLQRQANVAASAKPKLSLRPEEISLLPKFVYHPSTDSGFEDEPNSLALECAVCINELIDGEMIRVLPTCKHFFHVDCIDRWLSAHSSCPMCRARAHPELEKVNSGMVSASMLLPQLTSCTVADEQRDLGSFHLKSPPETSARHEVQLLSAPRDTDFHEIRIDVQPIDGEPVCDECT